MPFVPRELADAAAAGWLGFDPADPGPDIPISAFAVDGRRVSAQEPAPRRRGRTAAQTPHSAAGHVDYDDYEDHSTVAPDDSGDGLRKARRVAADGARTVGATVRSWGRGAWAKLQKRNRS